MSPSSLPALLLLLTADSLCQALPVSPSHRFAVFTPYWTRSPPAPQQLDCLVSLCEDNLPYIAPAAKRSKNVYKSGWTMGGMPFSVLYMNPKSQMSARSDSLPPAYDNSETLQLTDNVAPDSQALSASSPTTIPTRKQYSIIPQLFVSYGWGPLEKRSH